MLPKAGIIQAWLRDIPLATSLTEHHPHSNRHKTSSSPRTYSSQPPKRIALATTQVNAMASPKRHADDTPEGESTPKRQQILVHSDETPRARRPQTYTNSLAIYSCRTFDPPGQPSSPLSDDRAQSSTSNKSRSSSPVKTLGALRMTENPVEYSNNVSEMPSGRDLYKELSRCKSAQGVLPGALKDEITAAVGESDYLADSMYDSALTSNSDLYAILAQVKGILRRAQKCRELQDAEPGWNEQVHSRVLELALENQSSIGFQNITTAKIHPPAFMPKNVNGAPLQGKMVDYAICLESDPTESMFNRMRCTMQLEPTTSQYINHTSFEPLRFRPIAVSIETKVAGNETEATTQLSVWVVAHFKRLQVIMQRSGVYSEMAVLPLIHVQGHEWFTTLAVQGVSKTVLYGRVQIGATDTILGIYKILAALKVLRQWADTSYREWFNEILVPTGP